MKKRKYMNGGMPDAYQPVGLPSPSQIKKDKNLDPSFMSQLGQFGKVALPMFASVASPLIGGALSKMMANAGANKQLPIPDSPLLNESFQRTDYNSDIYNNNYREVVAANGGLLPAGGVKMNNTPDVQLSSNSLQVKGSPSITDNNKYSLGSRDIYLDHNEVVKDNMVFSNKLINPSTNNSFAKDAKSIEKALGKAEKGFTPEDKRTVEMLNNRSKALFNSQEALASTMGLRDNFAKGGIYIKPENRGKFTAQAESRGMGVQEFANKVMANPDEYSTTTVKRANFARNAAKFEDGGMIKRADGSYSRRGLWDNIRANRGSGKEPTKEMLEQERKIKSSMMMGGMIKNNYDTGGTLVSLDSTVINRLQPINGSLFDPVTKNYYTQEMTTGQYLLRTVPPQTTPQTTQTTPKTNSTTGKKTTTPVTAEEKKAIMEFQKYANTKGYKLKVTGKQDAKTEEAFTKLGATYVDMQQRGFQGASQADATKKIQAESDDLKNRIAYFNQNVGPRFVAPTIPYTRSTNIINAPTAAPMPNVTVPVQSTTPLPNNLLSAIPNTTNKPKGQMNIGDLSTGIQGAALASQLLRAMDKPTPEKERMLMSPISRQVFDPASQLAQSTRSYSSAMNALDVGSANTRRMIGNQMLSSKLAADQNIITQYDTMNQQAKSQYEQLLGQREAANVNLAMTTADLNARNLGAYNNAVDVAFSSLNNFGKGLADREEARKSLEMLKLLYPDVAGRLESLNKKPK
jgi:hypothetical protein